MEASFFLMFVIGLLALEARTSVYWEPKRRLKKSSGIEQVLPPFVSVFRVLQLGPYHLHLFIPSILNLNLSCAKKGKIQCKKGKPANKIDTNDETIPFYFFFHFVVSFLLVIFFSLSWKKSWKRNRWDEHREFLSVCWVIPAGYVLFVAY